MTTSLSAKSSGFTLIELSIVLVILGLVIGGVLVGRDLVDAAAVRSTITQIEKYNQAVNVFRTKYNAIPGDIDATTAATNGFAPRGLYSGEGDGDGILQGIWTNSAGAAAPGFSAGGETVMFWVDLSKAKLIEGAFNTAQIANVTGVNVTGNNLNLWLPKAAVGNNYIHTFSGGYSYNSSGGDGLNYFMLSAVYMIGGPSNWASTWSNPGLTVRQAYNIDQKIDDGLPQTGRVTAQYMNVALQVYQTTWAAASGYQGASNAGNNGPTTVATPASVRTCYDNGNVGGAVQAYSLSTGNGVGMNCALSFRFQ